MAGGSSRPPFELAEHLGEGKIRRKIETATRGLTRSPLLRASATLFLNSMLNLSLGFVATALAAKLYPTAAVGIAVTLIAQVGVITAFAKGGIDTACLRFFPTSSPAGFVRRVLVISLLLAVGLSIPVALYNAWFAPEIGSTDLLRATVGLTIGTAAFAGAAVGDSILIAWGKSHVVALRNIAVGILRIGLIFLFAFAGNASGVYDAYALSFLSGMLAVLALTHFLNPGSDRSTPPSDFWRYAVQNLPANLAVLGPATVLPLVVFHEFGSEASARFYVAFMIGYLGMLFPTFLGTAILSQRGAVSQRKYRRALLGGILFTSAFLLLMLLIGRQLLGIVGDDYVQAWGILIAVSAAGIPYGVSILSLNFLRRQGSHGLIGIGFVPNLTVILLFTLLAPRFGMISIGVIWFVVASCSAILGVVLTRRIAELNRGQVENIAEIVSP